MGKPAGIGVTYSPPNSFICFEIILLVLKGPKGPRLETGWQKAVVAVMLCFTTHVQKRRGACEQGSDSHSVILKKVTPTGCVLRACLVLHGSREYSPLLFRKAVGFMPLLTEASEHWEIWHLLSGHTTSHGKLGKYILCDKVQLLLINRGSRWLTPNSCATPRGWVLTNCNKSLSCQWWMEEGTCDQAEPMRDVCRGLLGQVSSHWRSGRQSLLTSGQWRVCLWCLEVLLPF